MMKIEQGITKFYKSEYGDYYENNSELINNSIKASVQTGYQPEYFPGNEGSIR